MSGLTDASISESWHVLPSMRSATRGHTGDQRGTTAPQITVLGGTALLIGGMGVSATSSTEARVWEAPYVRPAEGTAGGPGALASPGERSAFEATDPDSPAAEPVATAASEVEGESTRRAVGELRRLSGLTWEQLAELFGVSRRSLHFWASGKPLSASNEQRLMGVLDAIRFVDRGDARANRTALVAVHAGVSAFGLLMTGELGAARALLGPGAGRRPTPRVALSPEASAERSPRPPELLVDARHDRVHREPGRVRSARAVRRPGREPR